jgi:glycine cleavage system H lipoate-binding protein
MVALFVIAIVLCALTADYVVQRLAHRAPAWNARAEAFDGVFMDSGHLWIKPEPSGMARVGADNLIGVLLGHPQRVVWPPAGPVKRGAPLAVIHGRGHTLTLRSPVDGEVVEQNAGFGIVPADGLRGSFGAGWLARLQPVDLGPRLAAMRTGRSLRDWSLREMDRLRAFLLSRLPASAVGATAADGGPLSVDLASRLDDDAWNEAVRLMLGSKWHDEDEAPDLSTASIGGRP